LGTLTSQQFNSAITPKRECNILNREKYQKAKRRPVMGSFWRPIPPQLLLRLTRYGDFHSFNGWILVVDSIK